MIPQKEMSLRRPYGTPGFIWAVRVPHASTPRNKDRFLGTPVKRGANKFAAANASGALIWTLLMQPSIRPQVLCGFCGTLRLRSGQALKSCPFAAPFMQPVSGNAKAYGFRNWSLRWCAVRISATNAVANETPDSAKKALLHPYATLMRATVTPESQPAM